MYRDKNRAICYFHKYCMQKFCYLFDTKLSLQILFNQTVPTPQYIIYFSHKFFFLNLFFIVSWVFKRHNLIFLIVLILTSLKGLNRCQSYSRFWNISSKQDASSDIHPSQGLLDFHLHD